MAAFGWQRERSIEEWLFAEAYRFDFFQAVHLLETIFPDAAPVGEGAEPEKEPVRFRARIGFDFPAGEVHDLLPSSPDAIPLMITNFLGLAGASGPLPAPLAELALERIRQRDTGLRDFLDIFNHRLISLMYRTRKVHRVALSSASPEQGPMANYLYAFLGLGHSGLRNRMDIPDRSLLPYAGLLGQRPRSVVGLEHILCDYFQVPVRIEQFSGVWRTIQQDQWTRLGRSGRNQALGKTVVLGTRVWDQQGRFWIIAGALSLQQFLHFLPDGNAYHALCAMARFYVGEEHEFRLRLKIQAPEIPSLHLGKAKLGWTTWLKTRASETDSEIHLSSDYQSHAPTQTAPVPIKPILAARASAGSGAAR